MLKYRLIGIVRNPRKLLLEILEIICDKYLKSRVVPDIKLDGYLAEYPAFFYISGIRPDIRFHLPDILLNK